MKLTPEDQSKLRDKELANIIRKLNAGKTLTAREEAKLAAATAAGESTASALPTRSFALSWQELADELTKAIGHTVTRRSLQTWRNDPRYAAKCPPDRADGRREVAAWLRFMIENGLRRADEAFPAGNDPENEDDDDAGDLIRPPRIGGSQAEWKTANLALEHRSKLTEMEKKEGRLLVAAHLEVPLGSMLAAFQNKACQFADTAARRVKGLRDEAECREVLRDEVDVMLTDLQLGGYTSERAIADALGAVPFDDATEALCQKLLFDGADRAALMHLAGAIATEAVRRLGSRALSLTSNGAETLAVAEVDTGQVSPDAEEASADARAAVPSNAHTAPPKAPEPSGQEKPATEAPVESPAHRPSKSRSRKPRPTPTTPPGEIEGAIVKVPPKRAKRRR